MDIPTLRLPRSPPSTSTPAANIHDTHFPKPSYSFLLFHRSLRRPQVLNVSPLISAKLARTMADAESSITDSSLAPSTTPTSLLESVVPVLHSPSDRTEKTERRASLGLIDAARVRFSKDFHSLLRSNSKSQRSRTVLSTQAEDPESEHLLYSSYVKLAPHAVDLEVQSMDDSAAAAAEDRPGRGFGARIANFLNRSRSRSRSKKRRSRSLDAFPVVDPMPTTLHAASLRLHAHHSSLEPDMDAAAVAGPSRPSTRSPSRPLSGVAVPANASSKSRSKRGPDQKSGPTATAELVAQLLPMEPTKSSSSRKGKSFNIFGMLLSSPRKSSFGEPARGRSRPTTPSPVAPAAPDPLWQGSEDHTWATKSGSQRSHKSTRKDIPVHADEDSNAQCIPYISTDHHGKSSALPGLVSPQPRRAPIHVLNSPPPMPRSGYMKPEATVQSRDSDTSMLEGRCSPLCGLGGSSKGSHTSQEKGKERERMRGARDRSRERERERDRTADRQQKEKEKARELRRDQEMREKEREQPHIITHPRRVGSPLPSRDRPRESTSAVAVSAVPLEKTTSNRSAGSKHSGSRDHHQGQGHPRSGLDGAAARAKRIKHGSFDFERPVSAGVGGGSGGGNAGLNVRSALRTMGIGGPAPAPHPLQRSLSARAPPSRRPTDDSQDAGFAPSSLPNTRPILDKGKRKPTADVHFADPPSRRATDNSQSSSNHHHHQQSSSHTRSGLTVPSHHRDGVPSSPISSHSGSSSQHGRDGSWGRNGAMRMARASHGPFKFEPAVPPIPGSPADNQRRPTTREATRPESPLSDVGASRSKQARMAGKGRSLDLGLGLTWAPTRVREEAVLNVGPRRMGMSASTSAARSQSRWRNADEDGRLGVGTASDVAEAFKEALGDSAYGIFKTYVHRFDANAIPLDGPYGLLVHVERLLDSAPGVDQRRKRLLLERFLRVVQESR
ncbi:hypothetical protein BV20DRAFT_1048085 [Pilatotrama ljubarskyi]|nr:hypothetical protein BV20DRAFT_1048085 [Pilatotrama ljubarskyi]